MEKDKKIVLGVFLASAIATFVVSAKAEDGSNMANLKYLFGAVAIGSVSYLVIKK